MGHQSKLEAKTTTIKLFKIMQNGKTNASETKLNIILKI